MNSKLKLKKSVSFVSSSPDAIVHLVQKALFTCKMIQKTYTLRTPISIIFGNVLKLGPSE